MTAKNIGIIYSASQQIIRRTIDPRWLGWDRTGQTTNDPYFRVPDPNAENEEAAMAQIALKNGEAWAVVPIDEYDTHTHPLQTHQYLGLTGIPGITDRCIVHDGVKVQAVITGDPAIDTHSLGTVIADATGKASVGMQVVNGVVLIPNPIAVNGDIFPVGSV